MPTADPARIRAVVASQRPDDRRHVLAIRADPNWTGPDVLDGKPPIRVVAARSPLAAREAVARHHHTDSPDTGHGCDEVLVLLTDCTSGDLGVDLRARLLGGGVQTFDPFASVLALFKAQVLDPVVADERWLIDELIALAPANGWAPIAPLNGVLTADAAWETWQQARLGVTETPSTLRSVLDLAEDPGIRRSLAGLSDETRERVAARWAPAAPAATNVIVDLPADTNGAGEPVSATALGLVVDLLWAATDDPVLAQRQILGRVRLETELGRDRLGPDDAAAWGQASMERVAHPGDTSDAVADAERLLAKHDALELTVLSDVLPRGFEARLDALGAALAAGDSARATAALAEVERHVLANRRPRRVTACRAALRLLRRTRSEVQLPSDASFAELAVGYRAELAWVEQARRDLSSGEQSAPLAAAFAHLADGAASAQHAAAAVFSAALAEWSKSAPTPDSRIVVVEDLLDTVVAPVARDAPVMLVVCDGMGLSVSHQLIADLRDDGWAPAGPAGSGRWPVGVAVLPTVTSASRTSLLTGRLGDGGQAQERVGFAGHRALRHAGRATRPPVLFHKAGLVAANGAALPDQIRAAVADADQRVVGVVVNSVDDHLARGDQVNVGWDLASLGPLAWLLDAASEAGRVVIITADHGHVLDHGRSLSRPQPTEGGERWRTAATPAGDGEILISGPRVRLGGGQVILPFDERIRYGPPKHGYHGGATPEEVLVPVEVLARRLPARWAYQPVATPPWWDETTVVPLPVPAAPRVLPAPAVAPPRPSAQPTLFEAAASAELVAVPEPAPRRATWVDALLASPTFQAHRAGVRLPRPLPDVRLRGYLDAMAANGATIALPALAALTGEPAGTLRMTLSVVQRLLNVDGSPILVVRADASVVCNLELLAQQFDLDLTPAIGRDSDAREG
jgi:hypothetical protein